MTEKQKQQIIRLHCSRAGRKGGRAVTRPQHQAAARAAWAGPNKPGRKKSTAAPPVVSAVYGTQDNPYIHDNQH